MILLLLLIFSSFLVSLLSWLAVLLRPPDNVLLDLRKGPPSGESKVLLLTGLVPLLKHGIENNDTVVSILYMVYKYNFRQTNFNDFSITNYSFQELRFIQYIKNWHSLTPFWTPHAWQKHVIESLTTFTSSAIVDHVIFYFSQQHLQMTYNCIWGTEIAFEIKKQKKKCCSCIRILLCYPWCLLEDEPNFP